MSKDIPQNSITDYKFYVIPNVTSNASYPSPTIHQVKLQKPILDRDTSISIALDSTFEPISGAYNASSKYPLYLNTILYFKDGDEYKSIQIVDDNYSITTTFSTVNIRMPKQAITINAIAQSYLAAPDSGIRADRNGSILTIQYPSQCRIGQTIQTMGDDLADIFFAKDYGQKRSYEIGVVQLKHPINDTLRVIQGNLRRQSECNDETERMRWGMSL
jgi:hypothetical protein